MPTATSSSYEDPTGSNGLELPRSAPQSNEDGIGEDDNGQNFQHEDEDNAIFQTNDEHEEHMVTATEDSWLKTFAGVAGNVLEWYDFAVFGYFSDILGAVFFPPNQDGHAAIVESFAVFGGAFFMRPVGGMMMGYIGDKYGSRKALTISIFLMAFPTVS